MRADHPLFNQLATMSIPRLILTALSAYLLLPLVLQSATAPNASHAPVDEPAIAASSRAQVTKIPDDGERIAFIGNGLAERDLFMGRLETELHLRFPTKRLIVRNMGRSGDTPGFRPHPARASQWAFPGAAEFNPELNSHFGKGFFPTPDQWLTHLRADTIVAFFGYNESFGGERALPRFEAELEAFTKHTLSKAYNGAAAPRLVLVTPTAFEDLSSKRDLPTGQAENASLRRYAEAILRVAKKYNLTAVDLFSPSLNHLTQRDRKPFTMNGFSLTDSGYQQVSQWLADAMFPNSTRSLAAQPEKVKEAVLEKNYFWMNDFHIVNGVHTHGQRYNPYGPQNYQDEILKSREMTSLRDHLIHEVASGARHDVMVDDSATRSLPPVPTNFSRKVEFVEGEKAMDLFMMMNGYKAQLFASEKDFPELRNPVQMSFDAKGRLWVAVTPTYPHFRPGDSRPDDKILIFEDTDHDGRADTMKVFADHLHLPIGFELAPEGVYVSQEPNLCLLVDENGDDRADRMEILLHGFDSHDTHHAISAYSADASGAFYLLEGRFLHSQVETPYGPRRCNDGGVWRFNPASFRLERHSQTDINNPWGIAFDHWEQCFISDASSGDNWYGLPIAAKMPYGVEIEKFQTFVPKRSRPTSGSEFVSSRHFPDEVQGHFMTCNSIGFLGINFSSVTQDGSGFTGKLAGDLLASNDPNFRPVDLEFAPDGSLYFIDWHNPLIGHMQHNARDPQRDHDHGRIYRITYPARPLVQPAKIAGATIPQLLENLKLPEYRTRYRTRRELRGRAKHEVLDAIRSWVKALDSSDAAYEHHLCEALWATWAQNEPDADLLNRCLGARAPEARAAAAGVVRLGYHRIPQHAELLLRAASDDHPRVRLEAIIAASWLDNADGAKILLEALRKPLDRWMGPVTKQIASLTLKDDLDALSATELQPEHQAVLSALRANTLTFPKPETAANQIGKVGPTRKLTGEDNRMYNIGKEVFLRDAHCATCHQPNGQGIANVYPSLVGSAWLKDDERLIKLALKGLWGPIEVNGQRFDPSKGVPPMTGFGGLLNDMELAAVLTFVRQSWGNDLELVDPDTVRKVRAETKSRANFYMADELLKEHPFVP